MTRSRYGNLIRLRSATSISTRCNNPIILRSDNQVAFRSGSTISFRPGLKQAKVHPDLNPIKTRGSMQSRPDRACRSDSDPIYMIGSRYGNLIRFRSGAPIYTRCNNPIILRSGKSIVFRSDTTISFRPGLKQANVQPDLNPIKTRGSLQSRPDRACGSDSDPVFMTRSTSGNLICNRSGTSISARCNYLIWQSSRFQIWQACQFQILHSDLSQMWYLRRF